LRFSEKKLGGPSPKLRPSAHKDRLLFAGREGKKNWANFGPQKGSFRQGRTRGGWGGGAPRTKLGGKHFSAIQCVIEEEKAHRLMDS